jgi:hypothetical protein
MTDEVVPPDREEKLIQEAIAEVREAEKELSQAENKLERVEEELEHRHRFLTVIVDGTPHELPKRERATYAEIVTLAYPDYPQHPNITYSVTYERGPWENPEGPLPPGGSVKIKEGMSFIVNRTGES